VGVSKLVIKKREGRGAHLCSPLPVPTLLAVALPVTIVVVVVLPPVVVVVVAALSLEAVEEVVVVMVVVVVVAGSCGCG
jgi:hypothetical protein